MSLAIDSSIVDALIFYVADQTGNPVYQIGKIVVKPLVKEKGKSSSIVAIQFQAKDLPLASKTNALPLEKVYSEREKPPLQTNNIQDIDSDRFSEPLPSNSKKIKNIEEIAKLLPKKKKNSTTKVLKNPKGKSKLVKPEEALAPGAKNIFSNSLTNLSANLETTSSEFGVKNSAPINLSNVNSKFVGGKVSILTLIKSIPRKSWQYNASLDRFVVRYDSETEMVLTIRPALQKALQTLFERANCKIGAGIIQDPYSGAILAMTSYDGQRALSPTDHEYSLENWALKATFPVASIFKVITASAGFEQKTVTPTSKFRVGKRSTIEFWRAFATSHNGVFGTVGRKLGTPILQRFANSFGFNRPFYFDLPVTPSKGIIPDKEGLVGQTAAGLNKEIEISPIHVSSIISTILTNGKMMKPFLVETVLYRGKVIFRRKPFQLGKPISGDTASTIHEMMKMTISHGTGRRGFTHFKDVPEFADLCGGKTGTLTGLNPKILCNWFGGFTQAGGRELCLVVLVGGGKQVKATGLAGRFSHDLYVARSLNN